MKVVHKKCHVFQKIIEKFEKNCLKADKNLKNPKFEKKEQNGSCKSVQST